METIEGDFLRLFASVIAQTGPVTIDLSSYETIDAGGLKIEAAGDKITISIE